MIKKILNKLFLLISCLVLLAGCETTPIVKSDQTPPPKEVAFLDGDNFDHKLGDSLAFDHEEVSVKIYDKFSPNKMPPRIQQWVSHLEKNGGKIQLVEPPSESGVTAKDPFLIFSLINAIRSMLPIAEQVQSEKNYYTNTKDRDVKVLLARNANNEVVVDRLVFVKKKPVN
jgi:hypothetical protein